MKLAFRQSFERDLKKLHGNASLLARLRKTVEQLEAAESLRGFPDVKQMQGWSAYYRIRIGDYRLGVKLEEDELLVLRFMHRRDIYRRFP